MTTRLPTTTRNALADALTALIDAGPAGGTLKIYTGAQPASANDAAQGVLLVTLTFADPAAAAAATGVATLDTTPALEGTAVAAGDAGWFRIADSTGATRLDGAVTATGGGGQLTLVSIAITVSMTVRITAGTITVPAA